MQHPLEGCHVLLADDEPLIAMALAEELEEAGAFVVGPAANLEDATSLAATEDIDAAVLDIKLGDQMVFQTADTLMARRIPFVFATGCWMGDIPTKYAEVPICEKPFKLHAVVDALLGLTGGRCLRIPAQARETASAGAPHARD